MEPNRPFYERIFWTIVLAFVCFWLVKTISNQTRNYLSNPVLMNINGKTVSVTDIPFPAMSFCSLNQVHPSIVNLTYLLRKTNLTYDEYKKLQIGLKLCSFARSMSELVGLTIPKEKKNMTDEDLTKLILEYAATICTKTVRYFMWEEDEISEPCKYLQITLIETGACYSFNMLPVTQMFRKDHPNGHYSSMLNGLYQQDYKFLKSDKVWTPDTGYKDVNSYKNDIVPLKLSTTTEDFGYAIFLLDYNVDDMDVNCVEGSHAFVIAIHNPAELPSSYSTICVAITDRRTFIKITPKLITTSEELRSWSPEDRGCYFNHERKLKFFNIYTIRNCDQECDANITLKACNCSIFHHPRFKSAPVCGDEDIQCYARSLVQSSDIDDDRKACNCLPSCTELTYDIQYINLPYKMTEYKYLNRTIPENLALIFASYKVSKIKTVQRVAVITESDFLANIGGLLGLFLGFSVFNLFEIIFFSLRWMTYFWKSKNKNDVQFYQQ